MNSSTQSLLVGLVAGIASALLVVGSVDFSMLAVLLSVFATLPVLIAGLGWSNVAGAVSVVSAAAVVSFTVSPLAAAMVAVTSLGPAAWIAHLSNLARPAEEVGGQQGQLAWFPLSDIMLHLCALVSISLIILGISIGYSQEMVAAFVNEFFTILEQQNPELQADQDMRGDMIGFLSRFLPAVQGMVLVVVLFTAWYLASAIVRVSGRAKRPADPIPAALRMSRRSLPVFALALALSFLGGAIGYVGSAISGAFAGGFTLAGLAMLHQRTLGRAWRFIVLWSTYVVVVILFPLPLVAFLFAGLFETVRTSPSGPSSPNSNDQSQ